ncbi:hypothetical protein CR205_02990 [Alteribacter lacisalsi]|uniref:Uncharacterized protein n=1 Tax=Alteribacter lacisalsi TaxID=2045244 RepID=A0A2W0H9W3_9BACI|nr:hypothetical protein [Alteribacter lacisalsi]PYZ97576.1 hypothetical protein CR205_02990 [Alteribacter lacisalsi]
MLIAAISIIVHSWSVFLIQRLRFGSAGWGAAAAVIIPFPFYMIGMGIAASEGSEGLAYGTAFLTILLMVSGLIMAAVTVCLQFFVIRRKQA